MKATPRRVGPLTPPGPSTDDLIVLLHNLLTADKFAEAEPVVRRVADCRTTEDVTVPPADGVPLLALYQRIYDYADHLAKLRFRVRTSPAVQGMVASSAILTARQIVCHLDEHPDENLERAR